MINYCVDGSSFRTASGYVQMMTELDHIADIDAVRLEGRMEWLGVWVFTSTPAVHGTLPGVDLPRIGWRLIGREGHALPTAVELTQARADGSEAHGPLRCMLPIASDGLQLSHMLCESLPPHTAEELGNAVRAINKQLADEIAALEHNVQVPFYEGNGYDGGLHGKLSEMVTCGNHTVKGDG